MVVVVLAAAVRLPPLLHSSETEFLSHDGREYREISYQLSQGHGFAVGYYRWYEPVPPQAPALHADVYRPPLLPLLGAPLFWLPWPWLYSAKALLFCLAVLLVLCGMALAGAIARDQPWARVLTGLVLALNINLVFYATKWCTETLSALCVLAAFYALVRAAGFFSHGPLTPPSPQGGEGTWMWALGAGAALGLAALARPNVFLLVLFLLAALLWLLWRGRRQPPHPALSPKGSGTRWAGPLLTWLAVGAALVLAPWTVRQGLAGAGYTPMTAFGSYSHWMGTSPRMLASYRAADRASFERAQKEIYLVDTPAALRRLEEEGRFEAAQSGPRWRAWAWEWAAGNPGEAALLYGYRLAHFLKPWPSPFIAPAWQVWLAGWSNAACWALAIFWLCGGPWSWQRGTFFLLAPAANLVGCLPFVFHLRFRFPLTEVPLAVLAGAGLALLLARRRVLSTEY